MAPDITQASVEQHNAALTPTSTQIAERAYAAMKRPSKARIMFDRLLAADAERAVLWQTLPREEQQDVAAYAARRLELRETYGPMAEAMHSREERLEWLRRDEPSLPAAQKIAWVKRYYGTGSATFADFINDWGYTIDPRLISEGKNPVMAFELFPKQRDMIAWMIDRCWLRNKPGVVVKSRDVGASWVAMALLCTLCIFRHGFKAGVGSAVEIKIDRSGDPDTLFYKIRSFLEHLPPEFNGGFNVDTCSADKRVSFPLTGSSITGEAGDQAGRGGRSALFIVDESAHFEHPKIIDKNLSANTKCRIDMSSVNGPANSFYQRAHNPHIERFLFTWRDDPRKNQAWYDQMCLELDEVTLKQEIDCDFNASREGVCIPSQWVEAMIGIDEVVPSVREGSKRAALDIADRGIDLNAYCVAEGRLIVFAEQWSGKGSDTGYSVQRAMKLSEAHGLTSFDYDADGLGGAAVHSDARLINEARAEKQDELQRKPSTTPGEFFQHGQIQARPYRGSEAVLYPERIVPGTKRKAKDLFYNRKAQTWYNGRLGAFHAWKARRGERYEPSLVAGIARDCPLADLLRVQLSQASTKETLSGKIQIDKNPDDEASPDLADAALMALAPRKSSLDNVGARLTMIRAAM